MKALTYQGPGKKQWSEIPTPVVDKPTDAIVRILHTTICGTTWKNCGSRTLISQPVW